MDCEWTVVSYSKAPRKRRPAASGRARLASTSGGVTRASRASAADSGPGQRSGQRSARRAVEGASLSDVLATGVGVDIYAFLTPRELVAMSLVGRRPAEEIRANLFRILSRQMKGIDADGDGRRRVALSYKHSFSRREQVGEHLVARIARKNLRYSSICDPEPEHDIRRPSRRSEVTRAWLMTLEGTVDQVRKDLMDDDRWNDRWWGEDIRRTPEDMLTMSGSVSVGCSLALEPQREHFFDMYLREMVLHLRHLTPADKIARDWARYIVTKGVVGREWSWECDDDGVVGFMTFAPGNLPLEIRLKIRGFRQRVWNATGCSFGDIVPDVTW